MKHVTSSYLLRLTTSFCLLWEKESSKKSIYLTFDDGPTPGVTDEIITILDKFGVKATFFCVGEMVLKNNNLYCSLQKNGHRTGNHTFNHLNGWQTKTQEYLADIKKTQQYINSNLFRPPYGKLTPAQIYFLRKEFEIVMWSVLSGDFNKNINGESCLQNTIKKTKPGSIIVFHDSEKAAKNCLYALPRSIEYHLEKGYTYKTL